MNAIAERVAPRREVWAAIPLELIVSVLAVILAGGLKLAGLIP